MASLSQPTSSPLPGHIAAWAARTDEALVRFLNARNLPPTLDAAIRYALLGGGKRLRPILAMASAQAVGAPPESAIPAAAAIELVHAFSLAHDDLPAIDNDDLRRGRPTLHRHAGEAVAILAGDAMLALAFEALAPPDTPSALAADLTRELAQATTAMIAGQVLDTTGNEPAHEASSPEAQEDRLRRIHHGKTGALFVAACRMGARCGLAITPRPDANAYLDAITRYAQDVGLMFQIVDDLLDVEQPAEKVGKRTGKDAESGKLTFPGLWGTAQSRREVERLAASCVQAIERLGTEAEALRRVAAFLATRSA